MGYCIRQIEFGTPEFDLALALRNRILREPLGLEFYERDIEKEYDSYHFGAFDAQIHLYGCLTMQVLKDTTVKMRQVAVRSESQGKGIGTQMVRFVEHWAKGRGYAKIVLHARDVALPFYKKLQYGVVGKAFMEVGIKHYKMEKEIS